MCYAHQGGRGGGAEYGGEHAKRIQLTPAAATWARICCRRITAADQPVMMATTQLFLRQLRHSAERLFLKVTRQEHVSVVVVAVVVGQRWRFSVK